MTKKKDRLLANRVRIKAVVEKIRECGGDVVQYAVKENRAGKFLTESEYNKYISIRPKREKKKRQNKQVREGLRPMFGQRLRFSAVIERYGKKSAFKGPPVNTVLLRDIRLVDSDEILTDHLWFTKGKSWDGLSVGSVVQFDALVTKYKKGYRGHREDVYDAPERTDFRLERPTKIEDQETMKRFPQ